jgi:hypothetical protein
LKGLLHSRVRKKQGKEVKGREEREGKGRKGERKDRYLTQLVFTNRTLVERIY